MKRGSILRAVTIGVAAIFFSACTVVRPGESGLKQKLGKLKPTPLQTGAHYFNPFVTKIVKIDVRTVEVYENLPLPTKEGLSVNAQIALLYHVDPKMVSDVYTNFGLNYERVIVVSNFQATAREVSSRYFAKELYAIDREKVEQVMKDLLSDHLNDKGFIIDAVLLKDILLPESMSRAIQNKVNAEQAALQMDYIIEKQKKEAERMYIEAEGIRRAQNIIDSSLTTKLLQYNQIQMLKELSNSTNAKIIITNGQTPMIINEQ
ncbi:MAG: prohibitin family protein [Bacteroidetes bacterium]|nr:prohibitin family protein [Bacteroidota bacterium]